MREDLLLAAAVRVSLKAGEEILVGFLGYLLRRDAEAHCLRVRSAVEAHALLLHVGLHLRPLFRWHVGEVLLHVGHVAARRADLRFPQARLALRQLLTVSRCSSGKSKSD